MVRSSTSVIALLAAVALPAFAAHAADAEPSARPNPAMTDAADAGPAEDQIVVTGRRTRSVVTLEGPAIQKILPGISPLKAIQTLPGVTYLTADPWGNNEQNISLFIHGFNAQQLGYTLDGVPLGDQTYGNYNGLSPQRAVISENVGSVTLASGAGDLGTASTSNLGGTIDTFTSAPKREFGIAIQQTVGSYDAYRSYVRVDSGTFGGGNSLYLSGVRQDARAWDFKGKQGGYQANGKFVHEDDSGTLTLYGAYSDKTEPNEDATVFTKANLATAPYTRPFFYPDFAGEQLYLSSGAYAAAGSNYRNYYSAAQRTDYLTYTKYDLHVSNAITFSNQIYYHHDDGVGIVAGPINVAGLPQLFSFYYPGRTAAQLSGVFGGSGLAARTTEYLINRGGIISTLRAELGNHDIEIGGWYEHQRSHAFRRWYAVDVNNPRSPYERPRDYATPLIDQYESQVRVDEIQGHVQDSWHVLPNLTAMGGIKATIQAAKQRVPVQPIPGSFTGSVRLPEGTLKTHKYFLPQLGAVWDATPTEQLFVNAQKNVRQFQTSAASGLSPFALGSQAAFDLFRNQAKPETSITYEGGLRTRRTLELGPLTGFDGQISYYHVDFSNRLLAISPTPVITAIVSGAAILQNVGSVRTDGIDASGTFRFGPHFSLYNALSYNNSRYRDDYTSGTTLVPTKGKKVPGSPAWLNKTVVTASAGIFDAQLIGDYIGRRFATYTNDLSVKGYFTASLRVAARLPFGEQIGVKDATIALNITNLTDKQAASTLSIGAASGTFNAFPLAPRQFFGTLSLGF